jgi:hypothetical protein
MIELVIRLLLTVILLPVLLILGGGFSLLWAGYEGPGSEAARRRREEAKVRAWLEAHPIEAALVEREKQRRTTEERVRLAKAAAEKAEAEQKQRRDAQIAVEAALASPLSVKKRRVLSEMEFPPRVADLERLAHPDE